MESFSVLKMADMPTPSQIDYMKQHVEDDRRTEIIIANVICITVACIAVFARFYSRKIIRASLQADDWFIVAGLVRREQLSSRFVELTQYTRPYIRALLSALASLRAMEPAGTPSL